tara:strand:+ start:619 stop:1356 length:738 start_codon:yes stop_codon:yes gene_type:complete
MNSFEAIIRNTKTKGQLNKLRTEGNVPAIIYGGKNENQKIYLSKKQVNNLIEKENFSSDVIMLKVENEEFNVLPREITFDTVNDEPIHIDFLRIIEGSKIDLEIPVKFINDDKSPGLKRGGVLNIVRRKVELTCPTEKIPKELVVDLNELDIGASIKISSITLPDNVKPTISDRDFVIATVAAPTVVKEPEKQAETTEDGVESQEVSADGVAETTGDDKSKSAQDNEKVKDSEKKEDQKAQSEKK